LAQNRKTAFRYFF